MSTDRRFQPLRNSVADKVMTFFKANPDEFLSTDDIADKFDVPHLRVHSHLATAVDLNALKRWESISGELVYALPAYRSNGAPTVKADGPLPPVGDAFSDAAQQTQPKGRRGARVRAHVDTSVVMIDKGVPIPGRAHLVATDWVSLLDRMDVQDSAELPIHTRSSLQKCAHAYGSTHGKKFAVRKLNDQRLRIWRTV